MKHTMASPGAHGKKRSVVTRMLDWCTFRDEGQAIIEAALVLPVMMIAVTGILVFGIYLMQIMSLTEGVGNAGRVLAVNAGQTLDPCAVTVTAFQNAAPLLSPTNTSYQITLNPGTGNVSYPSSGSTAAASFTCSGTNTTSGAPGNLVSGGSATVKVTYTGCSLKFYGNNLLPSGCSISQQVTETVQ